VKTFSTIPRPEDSRDLDDVTWHTFRHSFASRLTRNGADLVTVKELLGHSSVSGTMRHAHTNRAAKRRSVELIAGNGAKLATAYRALKSLGVSVSYGNQVE
jgi:hypothetical protein